MKTKNAVFVIIAAFLASQGAFSQSKILDTYIEEGIRSNLQLKQEQLQYNRSIENLNQAQALFLPHVAANASYSLADGGRKIQFPIGDLLNPVYSTLNQLTGAAFPVLANQNIQFLPNDFHDTKVRLIQPIFNPDIYFNYKAQQSLITMQQAQKDAYENDLRYTISAAYYQYLQAEEGIRIIARTQHLLEELHKVNTSLVANHKATNDVVLNTEYELSKVGQQLEEARKNSAVAKAWFNFLLNRDLQADVEADTTLKAAMREDFQINDLTARALGQRQEIRQVQAGLQANQQLVSLNHTSALLPKVMAVGDVGYQGFYYKFNSDQRYWLVQFSLSWDLFKGGEKRSKTQQARLDYQITENKLEQLKKQIELQVIQTWRERAAAVQAWKSAQAGVRLAEKAHQITAARYREGQALMVEYLDAQNRLTTAQLNESITLYELLRKDAAVNKVIAGI